VDTAPNTKTPKIIAMNQSSLDTMLPTALHPATLSNMPRGMAMVRFETSSRRFRRSGGAEYAQVANAVTSTMAAQVQPTSTESATAVT